MASRALTFANDRGEQLAATLDLPVSGAPRGYALFAHCFTCGKDLKALRHISHALTANCIAVLRFDFTGLGASEGTFADTTFSSNVDDLLAAARHLEAEYAAPQILVGHSLGGTAVLAAAARLPSVKAVATIGAPFDAAHVIHHFEEHVAKSLYGYAIGYAQRYLTVNHLDEEMHCRLMELYAVTGDRDRLVDGRDG